MINQATGQRELCYIVKVDNILPIEGAEKVEQAIVGGWHIMVRKNQFQIGDLAVYFEIDSKVPEIEPFLFLKDKHYKIKTQKYFKGAVISQGLLMSLNDFPNIFEYDEKNQAWFYTEKNDRKIVCVNDFLTRILNVKYSVQEDNVRKSNSDKYKRMAERHSKLFKRSRLIQWLYQRKWGKKLLFIFLGKKKDSASGWPVGKFEGVSKTDQERCENMTWVLEDKTPYIVTQKCDGSSGTFILARKPFGKFEFYVCSRNVRMLKPDQKCFYGDDNYYWDAAIKYDIENKMKDYLQKNKDITFVCWQGEICAPGIQKNPHNLKELHLFCFHMTDSKNGRYDIREAKKIWDSYNMETVPIVDENYIMPDDFEEFKLQADGLYDASVCEGHTDCAREGFVYYKTTDPTFSFKNVSREYLLTR